jgi:nicotinamidase-related amidase
MEPKTTAIVLIEYQNDFTTTGGTLHDAVKSVMDTTHEWRVRLGFPHEAMLNISMVS